MYNKIVVSFALISMVGFINAMENNKKLPENPNTFIQLSPRTKTNNAQNKARLLPCNQGNQNDLNSGKYLLNQQKNKT